MWHAWQVCVHTCNTHKSTRFRGNQDAMPEAILNGRGTNEETTRAARHALSARALLRRPPLPATQPGSSLTGEARLHHGLGTGSRGTFLKTGCGSRRERTNLFFNSFSETYSSSSIYTVKLMREKMWQANRLFLICP